MKMPSIIILGIFICAVIIGISHYAKESHETNVENNTGYGTPTKIVVDNATVVASDYDVSLSGTIKHDPISVILNDNELKLPVVVKKTHEATVYRYKTHQHNKYIYYAESQGTLKNH